MKKSILVIDDDAQIRESLAKVLRAEGYEVRLAGDGQEAMDREGAARVDLLLLDLNLPQRSGWDLFESFTSMNPLCQSSLSRDETNSTNWRTRLELVR